MTGPRGTATTVHPEWSVAETVEWSRCLVGPALRAAVGRLPDGVRHIAGYHLGWWDRDGNPEHRGGKALRPAFTLLAAEAVGGAAHAAVPAAAAVELVHNFSLLHDDVMDGDETRRHRQAAWAVFGVGPAILAGDAMLAVACEVLAEDAHPKSAEVLALLTDAVQRLVSGQTEDLAFERRGEVSLEECRRMAENKTGALLGTACAAGALLGDATAVRTGHLRRFGENLGLAFQHVDDLLGILGDAERTGKPVLSDLRTRKKSLPVVATLTSATASGRELAALYRREGTLTEDELRRAAELVDAAGGLDFSRAEAERLLGESLNQLRLAEPCARTGELHALAGFITGRDR